MSLHHIKPGLINKTLEVPYSKSYANRLLILASICDEDVVIERIPDSTDVKNLVSCLRRIGLEIVKKNDSLTVKGSFPKCEKRSGFPVKVKTGDGGTTTRFLLALLARGSNCYEVIPKGHMRKRPMLPLMIALKSLGVLINQSEKQWITVQGPYRGGNKCLIDCSKSTQFASALMMATIDCQIEIKITKAEASIQYLKMTEGLIQSFIHKKRHYVVPVDSSSLSYPLAFAAVTGFVRISNCYNIDSSQADSKILEILKEIGAHIEITDGGLVCKKGTLRPFEVDGSLCPDLAPTLVFLASHIPGKSRINNLKVLRHKESDRIIEMTKILDAFRICYDLDCDDNLSVYGVGRPVVGPLTLYPAPDHRIIMMASLFLKTHQGGSIDHFYHVGKSYPNFLDVITN